MARIHHVKSAQQRYEMVPTLAPATGEQLTQPVSRRDGTPKTTRKGKPIVRRLTHADKSRPLPMPTCGKCGRTIEVGEPYKWVATKSGPYGGAKKYRCGTCPTWRPSELSSSKMATIMAAQEELADQIDGAESAADLEALRDSLVEAIREVADEYRESASNIVDGFGHETSQSEELEERADSLDGWADDLEALYFDESECEACGGDDSDECEACDGTGIEGLDDMRSELSSAADECPT